MVDSPLDATISVLVVRALLAGASLAGIEQSVLEQRAGFTPGTLDPASVAVSDARLPARVAVRLWQV